MKLDRTGVTRFVLLTRRWAIKVPRVYLPRPELDRGLLRPVDDFVRGWLANRSEWVQRRRRDVNPPVHTLAFFVSVYRRADALVHPRFAEAWEEDHAEIGYSYEERKASSWGRVGDRWLLIDYDRAWAEPRGFVGGIYYRRQERAARQWAELSAERAT